MPFLTLKLFPDKKLGSVCLLPAISGLPFKESSSGGRMTVPVWGLMCVDVRAAQVVSVAEVN
jgi:hypothetical protein